ncbi:insulinase family protein, partial [Pirellulaceae bacterium]|nr:insulinase family protein [Pirellulaceae bacterium]
TMKDRGSIFVYAGTSAERAQETLDVTVAELHRLTQGITQSELDRLKVSIRSSLVMQQESSRSRAASIAGDYFHLGKVRTLDEVTDIINGLTVERINEYIAANPPCDFNLVSLGQNQLEEPSGVSATSA